MPAGIESWRKPVVLENTSTSYDGSTCVGIPPSVKESTSNREPERPRNTRNSGPEPPDTDVVTFWKVSQSPVDGTATDPSSVPVAEPDRTSIVPPAPADEIRAVKDRAPAVLTDAYPAQSPFSM